MNTSNEIPLNQNQHELRKYMQFDAAELLYSNSVTGILISFIVSTMLVFGINSESSSQLGTIWWLLMTGVLLSRSADTLVRYSSNPKYRQFARSNAVQRYSIGVLATAAMWSIYASVIVRFTQSDTELASTLIVISSLAGGASTMLSSNKKLAMSYVSILMLPVCISLLALYDSEKQSLGMLGMCFWVVMMVTSKKSGEYTAESIRLKNVNTTLLDHMEKEVERRTDTIYELSNLDPLTGLFNRDAFTSRLEVGLNLSRVTGESLAVLFVDLDGFKKINDACGHEVGDQILAQTAERLKGLCRQEELLCRWGGDEFLIALSSVSEQEATNKARKVIERISQAYSFSDNRLTLGATIGIAMFPDHGITAKELIRMADTAMYSQKKNAPSKVRMFSEPLGTIIERELELKNGLSNAIANQQLRTTFQPLISSETGEIASFEALLRWNFKGQEISPDIFISIAEQFGLIRKIGAWVINDACRVAGSWGPENRIAISINVSVIQLQDDDFIDIVDLALANNQLNPNLLHIELTESVFAQDKVLITKQIGALQKRGIKVSIDDFGTGYSSLSAMQELSVDMVKIDRCFVQTLDENGSSIVNAVIHIAKALNYLVVAEGVETRRQAMQLSNAGVDFQQGYYFSRPMEERDVSNYMIRKPSPVRKLAAIK